MTGHFTVHETLHALDRPLLIGMLTGWIDAGASAAAALDLLDRTCETRAVVTFDGDVFVDYRARRPTMELRDGFNERLVWPTIELKVGKDRSGRDLVLLKGPEPDTAWRQFAEATTHLALQLGVEQAVFLGAYPFATPHTRPSRLSCSSPSRELLAKVPFLKSSVDVPAGMGAVLEHAFTAKGMPAIGLWAQVPHYVSAMGYPGASIALIEALHEVTDVDVSAGSLTDEAAAQRERIDQLVAGNDEHQSMVRQLESLYDAVEEASEVTPLTELTMPSADELGAELERFLRDQGK